MNLGKYSIRDAFDDFITAKIASGIATKTVETYTYHINSISPYLCTDMNIDEVTQKDIRKAVAGLAKKGISPNSVRSYTATLKSFFSWCRQEGLCDVEIALFKGVETIPQTYSREELEKLLKQPNFRKCEFSEYRCWVIINLLVNNGLRAGSIREIQIRDVYLDKRVILLRHTKTRKVLAMPLGSTMVSILEKYLKYRKGKPEDWLFCEESGVKLTENALRKAIARYNRSRGVKKTGIHMFRHTFAKMYIVDIGGNALKLQKLLGHSTLAMTKHYVQIYDQDLVDRWDDESPLETFHAKKKRVLT